MQTIENQLLLSATDLVNHVSCTHLTNLDLAVQRGELARPDHVDEARLMLADLGDAHEHAHLRALIDEGRVVAQIEMPKPTLEGLRGAHQATVDAMRMGADVVFQATFFDGRFRGHADFLYRVEKPSDLGEWSYEPYDAKLARSAKVTALVQLAQYAEQLAAAQGRWPETVHVILGDNTIESFPLREVAPYHRQMRRRLDTAIDTPGHTRPDPVDHCRVCAWAPHCDAEREAADHLTGVAGVRRTHVAKLSAVGITTAAALAAATAGQRPDTIAEATFERITRQARLQVAARTGEESVDVLDPATNPRGGFRLLPAPNPHDLYFDLEGDPHRGDGGLEYLWGISDAVDEYQCWWGHDPAEERRAFETVVDFFIAHLDTHPEARIYHYANYEVAVLRRLASRHASREAEVDRLLRDEVFVDLYAISRHAIQTSRPSMSIKALEHFYREARETEVVGGLQSVVAYEKWLETRDPDALEDIRLYNLDDCVSTRQLHHWLEKRRTEAETRWGPIPRPRSERAEVSPELLERQAAVAALADSLLAGLSEDREDHDDNAKVRWMLAHLADWHRREDKPGYWWYFRRLQMSDEELWLDSEAIAGLDYVGEVGSVKKSLLHEYRFDADQPYKLSPPASPIDPDTQSGCGTIVSLDPIEGKLVMRRSATSDAPHPTHLVPSQPINSSPLANAVFAVGQAAADGHLGRGRFGPIDALIRRHPPNLRGDAPLRLPDESASDAVVRVAPLLDESVLAVQGPPGSGKTTTAARMVKAALAAGLRVGVTSNSHAVINNLLGGIAKICEGANIIKVGGDDPEIVGCRHVSGSGRARRGWSNGEGKVIGGTAWLFSHPDMRASVDLLIVDEAGQVSLANTVASATAARSLVLFGDPQQLDQPIQGVHPPGLDASALGHLLGGAVTIPDDRGIFLDRTYRLHPEICEFISELAYEDRLEPAENCERRAISGVEQRLVFEQVVHHGNGSRSPEEAARVAALVGELVGRTLTDDDESTRNLTHSDILVIAPYNAQVRELAAALPDTVEVGTVDKFQGREAPVVIYSMTASSGEDISRGIEFLFSVNRFNVAISRAQSLAVVVGSPSLLDTPCRNPGQVRLVSALCRFAEVALP